MLIKVKMFKNIIMFIKNQNVILKEENKDKTIEQIKEKLPIAINSYLNQDLFLDELLVLYNSFLNYNQDDIFFKKIIAKKDIDKKIKILFKELIDNEFNLENIKKSVIFYNDIDCKLYNVDPFFEIFNEPIENDDDVKKIILEEVFNKFNQKEYIFKIK